MGNTLIIEPGDYVVDNSTELWEMRKVSYISGETLHMEDGGVMGIDEVTDVFLPGEIDGYN